MKKMMMALMAAGTLALFSGCVTVQPIGALYTEVKLPVTVGTLSKATKVGRAECKSICGLVAMGDASIEAAAKNGGITVIHHVDWEVENIAGIIGKYRCVVYGE